MSVFSSYLLTPPALSWFPNENITKLRRLRGVSVGEKDEQGRRTITCATDMADAIFVEFFDRVIAPQGATIDSQTTSTTPRRLRRRTLIPRKEFDAIVAEAVQSDSPARAEAVELVRSGWLMRDVAKKFDISVDVVMAWVYLDHKERDPLKFQGWRVNKGGSTA